MLKNLGSAIWRHTRDMTVLNYPTAIVYEIYTSEGYIYMKYCKAKKIYQVDTVKPCPAYELVDVEVPQNKNKLINNVANLV
jgi:hypothetical protein